VSGSAKVVNGSKHFIFHDGPVGLVKHRRKAIRPGRFVARHFFNNTINLVLREWFG
jgi:hypothetical protein